MRHGASASASLIVSFIIHWHHSSIIVSSSKSQLHASHLSLSSFISNGESAFQVAASFILSFTRSRRQHQTPASLILASVFGIVHQKWWIGMGSSIHHIIHTIIGIIHQIRVSASNLNFMNRIFHWHRSSAMVNLHEVAASFVVSITISLTSFITSDFIRRICHWHRSSAMVNQHQVAASFVVSITISLTSFITSEHQHQISALFVVSSNTIVHQQWWICMR